MPKTEAKKRADNKYDLAHYSVIGCKLKKEEAELFKEACKRSGTTPNAVFRQAIDNFMASQGEDPGEPEAKEAKQDIKIEKKYY